MISPPTRVTATCSFSPPCAKHRKDDSVGADTSGVCVDRRPHVEPRHAFGSDAGQGRPTELRWFLPEGRDHRFEWTRDEFAAWTRAVGDSHDYEVVLQPVGDSDPEVGSPTQMAVFSLRGESEDAA